MHVSMRDHSLNSILGDNCIRIQKYDILTLRTANALVICFCISDIVGVRDDFYGWKMFLNVLHTVIIGFIIDQNDLIALRKRGRKS